MAEEDKQQIELELEDTQDTEVEVKAEEAAETEGLKKCGKQSVKKRKL